MLKYIQVLAEFMLIDSVSAISDKAAKDIKHQ